ncbi:TRAP transporter substrate-binding protein (plasmid) [Tistrella mobilis]|uniref:TRAP transporter substrate-binding protein n=1 Tax=Tistrella mobilis TaxID=171437 RepID=UPI003557B3CA
MTPGRIRASGARRSAIAALLLAAGLTATARAEDPAYITIATAAPDGAYHRLGLDTCRMINRRCAGRGLRCVVEPTNGTGDNLLHIAAGHVDLAFAQLDGVVRDQPDAILVSERGRCTTHPGGDASGDDRVLTGTEEALFILRRAEAGDRASPADLAGLLQMPGTLVSLGPAGSGTRNLAEALLAYLGIDLPAGREVALPADLQLPALCRQDVDIIFRMLAPARAALLLNAPRDSCRLQLIPVPADDPPDAPPLRRAVGVERRVITLSDLPEGDITVMTVTAPMVVLASPGLCAAGGGQLPPLLRNALSAIMGAGPSPETALPAATPAGCAAGH